LTLTAAICAQPGVNGIAEQARQPKIELEAELERGETVSRLVLFIRNHTDSPYSFENGSRGGSGSLDDGFRFKENPGSQDPQDIETRGTIGTTPTVVPQFTFQFGEGGWIVLRTPAFGGPTRRSMRPHKVTVNPKTRVLYASFVVPTRHVTGSFGEARLKLPDIELRTADLTVRPVRDQKD
jgi:hypothetical protein